MFNGGDDSSRSAVAFVTILWVASRFEIAAEFSG